jgi:hypothetical protein
MESGARSALSSLGEGVNGEGDAVVDADLAHQAADVRLDGAFVDAERDGDLAVGLAGAEQVEHLEFARGELGPGRRGAAALRWLSSRRESTLRGAQTEPSRTMSMAMRISASVEVRAR